MNKIFKLFGSSLMVTMALTACSPETFDGPDQNGLPSMTGVSINKDIDQTVNEATFTVANLPQGTYPIWTINGSTYSTLSKVSWANSKAGTYDIELRLGNRNGFSQASISESFTFDKSQVDFTPYINRISRMWRINHTEVGHMGCGEPGTDGSNWWCAEPEAKADWGVYDDRITFSADGVYDYSPGDGGTMYVNTGCSIFSEFNTNDGQDFMAKVDAQTSNYSFDVDGDKIILKLGANTQFPYISSDAQFANPVFTVVKLTNSEMVLLYEGNGITWRFMLTSKEDDTPVAFKGYKFDSDGNMLKNATWEISRYYAHGDGWDGYNAEDISYTNEGNQKFVVTLPYESNQRWQAQFQLQNLGGVSTVAGKNYDFSIKLKANQDLNSATVKLTDATDDKNFYFDEVVPLEGDSEYLLYKSNMEGRDIALLHLVFDFGGCQAGTVVEITDMVLKDHAFDDGAGQPDEGGQGGGGTDPTPTMDWDYNSGANLWKAVDEGSMFESYFYYMADNNWSGISYQEVTHNGDTYELTLPEGLGGSQWQGQFAIQSKVAASQSKKYNFYCVLEADQDCPGVTIKLVETNVDDTDAGKRDQNFFFADRHNVEAGEPFIYKAEGVSLSQADAHALSLWFDFGGSTAGAKVKISKIYLEEASEPVSMNYEDADNLWKAVDEGSMFESYFYYMADNNWSGISYQEVTHNGDTYELTLPEGLGGSQWQGQFAIQSKVAASQSKKYNFSCVVEADQDCPGVTIKLVETNVDDTDAGKRDQNFFFADRHNVEGGEPFVYTAEGVTLTQADAHALSLWFDFGGSPAGANVKISKIVFKEAQ